MGCGAGKQSDAVTVWSDGEACSEERERPRRSTASEFREHLDELVARLIFEEELAGLRHYSSSTVSTGNNEPQEEKSLTACEVNTHSSILNIETPQEGSDSWTKALMKQECAMCLEEFAVGDKLRILHCHHTFHTHCIDAWFARARTCPFCLQDITKLPPPDVPFPSHKCLLSPLTSTMDPPSAPSKEPHEDNQPP